MSSLISSVKKKKVATTKGGDYIGSGTYACAFRPSLKCSGTPLPKNKNKNENKNKNTTSSISKLFFKAKDMHKELAELKRVEKIDSEHKFTVANLGSCAFNTKDATVNDHLESCQGLEPGKHMQIILEYGGKDLNTVDVKTVPFNDIIIAAESLFYGLKKLHEMNLVHQDLKPDNILYDQEKKSLRIIDFGISQEYDTIWRKDLFNANYIYHPPEYIMFNLVLNSIVDQNMLKPTVNEYCKLMTAHIHSNKGIIKEFRPNYKEEWKEFADEVLADTKDMTVLQLQRYFKKYISCYKIDTYGAGVALAETYARWAKKDVSLRNPNPKEKGTNIKTLISSMMAADPAKRVSPEEAYVVYNQLLKMGLKK
jgi:serine/threonine protein kinase